MSDEPRDSGPPPRGPILPAVVDGTTALAAKVAVQTSALRAKLIGPQASNVMWGWLGPAIITVIAAVLTLVNLGNPHSLVFDETYYVKDAYSLLQKGYEANWPANPNPAFEAGDVNQLLNSPEFVVHPPVGKWVIAFGEWLFGAQSSFGWRFGPALLGIISVFMICRIARRLFGSTLLGCTAGLLLTVDGEHLVLSRTGLLDITVMFFALAAFGFILIDRDLSRAKLARLVAERKSRGQPLEGWGPKLGMRWPLLGAGIMLGLCTATKWSGMYFIAVFGIMVVCWDCSARRTLGVKRWWLASPVMDGIKSFVLLVPVALVTYLITWSGWLFTSGGYDRQWGANQRAQHAAAIGQTALPENSGSWFERTWTFWSDALNSLVHYHYEAYQFHIGLDTPHPYQSHPAGWLIQWRPTAFYAASEPTCGSSSCVQVINSLGNPIVWWVAAIGLIAVVAYAVMWADWRAWAILSGYLAGYVPWFMYPDRTIFTFYTVAFVPWVVLALTYFLGLILGPKTASPRRRKRGAIIAGAIVVLAIIVAAYFYPIWTAGSISTRSWQLHMWLPTWA